MYTYSIIQHLKVTFIRVVGVHLRMSNVSRGGIRWSDRTEDYRTEVLGLMQAQDLKNAVIVPDGAKGVFIPKQLNRYTTPDERYEEARACYTTFITAILEIADNYIDNDIIHPRDVVRHDGDDPYLVVAADKGTAKFSDTANEISRKYNFWLDDAFASGGKHGYDHKILGITAKGAWQSVMWHFASLGINPEQDVMTVVGIGDMSGDVFGNGMLLSKTLKLVAAFDHRSIFLDPNPNPQSSFKERERMFGLARSSWESYNPSLISTGGGVYSRECKYIVISPQVAHSLQISAQKLTPNQLIQAIMKAPVDLLWNGGIGTYVRSSGQTDRECQDPANDACRISANDLRAKVVGEGGNLGFTQDARIEYLLQGGLMNTDFVDNAGGVMCSDNEVNIKILLQMLVAADKITYNQRNMLLEELIPDVTELVLKNVYLQNLALSIAELKLDTKLEIYQRYIEILVKNQDLDPEVNRVPDREAVSQRLANNQQPMTRAEMAILLSRAKSLLVHSMKKGDFIDSQHCLIYLEKSFPEVFKTKYANWMTKHQLRRDIIATHLANICVSDMGITYIQQMSDETGCDVQTAVIAYHFAVDIYALKPITALLHDHAYHFDKKTFLEIYDDIRSLLRHTAKWLIQNISLDLSDDCMSTIQAIAKDIEVLRGSVQVRLAPEEINEIAQRDEVLDQYPMPDTVKEKLLYLRHYTPLINIAFATYQLDGVKSDFMSTYYTLTKRLNITWLSNHLDDYPVDSIWTQIAKVDLMTQVETLQRVMALELYGRIDSKHFDEATIEAALLNMFEEAVSSWDEFFAELSSIPQINFAIFTVMLKRLQSLNKTLFKSA